MNTHYVIYIEALSYLTCIYWEKFNNVPNYLTTNMECLFLEPDIASEFQKWSVSSTVTRLGDFEMFWWQIFLKSSQNLWWLFGLKWKTLFYSKSFYGHFWQNLGYFYFNICGLYYKNWTSVIDADAARSVMKTLESSDAASVVPCIIKQYFLVVTTLLNLRSSFCCQRYQ